MDLKEKTREELADKIERLENIIARKGVGSEYLSKAERIQRDVNLALILGGVAAITGITAWTLYKYNGE